MHRRAFLAGAAVRASSAPRKPGPNLLLIVADRWRAQAMPRTDPDLRAPALSRLVETSMSFSRAYSACPLGAPAVAALLTGRFPHSSRTVSENATLPADERCLAEIMKQAGYRTAHAGKGQLDVSKAPGRGGFDEFADHPVRALATLIGQSKPGPFFLMVSLTLDVPPRPSSSPPMLRPNVPADDRQVRLALAGFYTACTAVDSILDALLSELQKTGLEQDTTVAFTSAHGDMLGSHGLDGWGVPFEESVAVPLVVRHRGGIRPGHVSDLLVSGVDLAPTLAALCGVPSLDKAQGQDLSRIISGDGGDRPESVFAEGFGNEWRMVVRGLDKIVVNARREATHLYNLGQDPYELENLVADPAHERRRDELLAWVRMWTRRTSDGVVPSGLKRR